MIQHFLEERFHKAVRFFGGMKAKDIEAIGTVKIEGGLTLNGDDVARPYKVYTALLTQTGTDAPVATVLENTLGVDLTPSYIDSGWYSLNSPVSMFVSGKVTVTFTNGTGFSIVTGRRTSTSGIQIKCYDPLNGNNIDTVLVQATIEVRVYP